MITQGDEKQKPKIALVHDELIRRGGAEATFEEICGLFPEADIYALYAGSPHLTINEKRRFIHTSFLQHFPRWFRRHPRRVLPFLPQAAEQFDLSRYDLVLSSASAFAKGVVTRALVPHICYCHTPTRYLWDDTHTAVQRSPRATRWLTRGLLHYLRMIDFAAAQRVDIWVANSRYTQNRIRAYYGHDSQVIYPPVETGFFTPISGSDLSVSKYNTPSVRERAPFLMAGRLTPAKKIEQAIQVCEKLQFPLVIVGAGREGKRLKKLAGKFTQFKGYVNREELRSLYRGARALLQPGIEDFGISSAEALACGTPVIAQNAGGVKEIVQSGRHGILYSGSHVEALAEGVRLFLQQEQQFSSGELQRRAMHFSTQRFQEGITQVVTNALARKNEGR